MSDELKRLKALDEYNLLDTHPESEYDEIVQLASQIFDTPISLVSLVDEDRQWFKAKVGLDASETPRSMAFCHHAINSDGVFEVPDTHKDKLFVDNPLVTGDPHIRFYAGAPLKNPAGHVLGTLCIIDRKPRKLSTQEKMGLEVLAKQVVKSFELRKKNARLQNNLAKYTELVEGGDALLCTHDLRGFIIDVNQRAAEKLGYTVQELVGKNMSEIMPQHAHAELGLYLKNIPTLKRSNGILELLTSNKELVYWSFYNTLSENGEKVIGFALDYTEAIKNKRKLREQNEILEEVKKLSPFGVFQFNITSGDVTWSDEVYEIFEVEKGRKIDFEFYQSLIHPDDLGRLLEVVNEAIESSSDFQIKHRIVCENGEVKTIEGAGRLVKSNPPKLVGSVMDISDHAERESELIKAKEQAEELGNLKQEFLANMSHEIRTPMSSIIGFARLLLKGEISDTDRHYAELIYAAGENLLSIVNDVLDFSKVQAGKLSIEAIEMDPTKLVTSSISLFNERAKDKGLRLLSDVGTKVPGAVMADATRITQVLNNLLSNAIKFTEKGFVEVHLSWHVSGNTSWLQYKVTDTGIGIETNKLDDIFNSFEQAEGSTTRKFGGTGLGLTISKHLVELMGGEMQVESEVGHGSTFSFTIPAKAVRISKRDSGIVSDEASVTSDLAGVKILMAEDNPNNQLLTKAYLSNYKAELTIANDGIEALEHIKKSEYDIILMDIQMPRLDGIKAAQRIKKNKNWKDIPIVALTAHALAEERERIKAVGMDYYLSKPFRPEELVSTISKALRLQQNSVEHQSSVASPEADVMDSLREYAMNDESLLRELVSTMARTLPPVIERLEKETELAEVKFSVHTIKPSITMMGQRKAVDLIARIEAASDGVDFSAEKAELVTMLHDLLEKLKV